MGRETPLLTLSSAGIRGILVIWMWMERTNGPSGQHDSICGAIRRNRTNPKLSRISPYWEGSPTLGQPHPAGAHGVLRHWGTLFTHNIHIHNDTLNIQTEHSHWIFRLNMWFQGVRLCRHPLPNGWCRSPQKSSKNQTSKNTFFFPAKMERHGIPLGTQKSQKSVKMHFQGTLFTSSDFSLEISWLSDPPEPCKRCSRLHETSMFTASPYPQNVIKMNP